MADPRSYKAGTRMALGVLGRGCYYPGCPTATFSWVGPEPYFNLEIAHICAAEKGGPRWRDDMNDDQRRAFWNVLLLCPGHHKAVDGDELTFSVDVLYEWKRGREGAVAGNLATLSDAEAAEIVSNKAAEMLREVRAAIDELAKVSERSAEILREAFDDGRVLVDQLDTQALGTFATAVESLDARALTAFSTAVEGLDTRALWAFVNASG